jgi:hypothetical protein
MERIGMCTSAAIAVLRFGSCPSKGYWRAIGKKITARSSFLAGRGNLKKYARKRRKQSTKEG